MFKIGDYVAHYKEGVCEVVNIGKIDMGSSDKEYYTLKPVYDAGGTVYTPVDNKRDQIRVSDQRDAKDRYHWCDKLKTAGRNVQERIVTQSVPGVDLTDQDFIWKK